MRKSIFCLFVIVALGAIATPALAQEAGGADSISIGLGISVLALGLAAAGGALGQGRAAAGALEGMARNPGAAGRIQAALLISLAFLESLVIFTFAMVFLIRGMAL